MNKQMRYILLLSLGWMSMPVAADVDLNVTGFLRQEMGYSTGDANVFNQYGNEFNGRTVVNSLGTPITRNGESGEPDWNLFATRAELDVKARFNDNWEGFLKIRGFSEWRLDDELEGLDYFSSGFDNGRGQTFEGNGKDWAIDLPAMYLDYNNGGFWMRIGNQQIAWGEAIFFRVFDVPNGLDLRRHSILDVAAEEYSDKRVSSLGIRASYRFQNDWELEGYAQHFRPSVLMPRNSPYNVVASQFTVHEKEGWDDRDDEINVGLRLSGRAGDFDLSFMAVSRMNPDGAFRWTETGVNPFAGIGDPTLEFVGDLLSQTPFEPQPFEATPTGVWTAAEWFHYAGAARLDGLAGLNAAINEFPAAQLLGAAAVPDRMNANLLLDVFFDPVVGPLVGGGLGPLRGHIAREYHREEIFGFSMNYVFNGEPNTLFDQLVLRFEATYALDRTFTSPDLSTDFLEEDELITNLSLEKYHRFTSNFPATYFVLQYMHKSESDMLGRHVSGLDNDGIPDGESGFNAVAFAVQQPFPGLVWRADLSVLYDTNGGYLIQPGVRWRPRDDVQVDLYANFIGSDGDNDDVMETFETQDEVFARLTWYF